ncbi:hypothetical protein LXL04_004835 [Taraxacum kok-saghyz]
MKLMPYNSDERRIQKIAYPVFSPGIIYLLFSAFIQEFRNWELAWALEALYVVVYEVRILAERVRNLLRSFIVQGITFKWYRKEDVGMNAIELVFSFVFGDGDLNEGIEEETWAENAVQQAVRLYDVFLCLFRCGFPLQQKKAERRAKPDEIANRRRKREQVLEEIKRLRN